MRQGIHLGEKRDVRATRVWLWFTVAVVVGTLLNGLGAHRAQRRNESTRSEIALLEEAVLVSDDARIELDSGAIESLSVLVQSKVSRAPALTEIVFLISETLPRGLQVQTVSLEVSDTENTIALTAVGRDSASIAAWQGRLDRDTRIARTELLEERPHPEGGRAVRLRIGLSRSGPARAGQRIHGAAP